MFQHGALSVAMQHMPVHDACELLVKVLGDAQKNARHMSAGHHHYSQLEGMPPRLSAAVTMMHDNLTTHALCTFDEILRQTGIACMFDEDRAMIHRDDAHGDWFAVPPLRLVRQMIFKPAAFPQAECDYHVDQALTQARKGCNATYRRLYQMQNDDGIKFKYGGLLVPNEDLVTTSEITVHAVMHNSYIHRDSEPQWMTSTPSVTLVAVDGAWRDEIFDRLRDESVQLSITPDGLNYRVKVVLREGVEVWIQVFANEIVENARDIFIMAIFACNHVVQRWENDTLSLFVHRWVF